MYLRLHNKRFIYLNAKQGIRVQIECIDFNICSMELDQSNKSTRFFFLFIRAVAPADAFATAAGAAHVLPFKAIVCVRVFYS